MGRTVAVFGSSRAQPGEESYEQGVRCGHLLATAGFQVATGGYGGIMEAVSRGAAESGGTVIAATSPELFPTRPGANEWVHIESPQPTLSLRLSQLLDDSVAAIALPGSIGTFTELMVAWNAAFLQQLAGRSPMPVVAVGRQWAELVATIGGEVGSAELVAVAATVDDAVATLIAAVGTE